MKARILFIAFFLMTVLLLNVGVDNLASAPQSFEVLDTANLQANLPGYPLVEEFDSAVDFTSTSPSNVYVDEANSQAVLNVHRSYTRLLYRTIPDLTSGDFRMTMKGQFNYANNNCGYLVRLTDEVPLPGVTTSGVTIRPGFFGGGCPNRFNHIMASWNYPDGNGNHSTFSGYSCGGSNGTIIPINRGVPYKAELEIRSSQGTGTLNVFDNSDNLVGSLSGPASLTSDFGTLKVLSLGLVGGGDWPSCGGTVDTVIIESLETEPQDTTPPVWNSTPGGIQDAYQVADETIRVFWNEASDPESSEIYYRLSSFYNDIGEVFCDRSLSEATGFDCHDDFDGLSNTASYRFRIDAKNDTGLKASDETNGVTLSMFDFKTFAEITTALRDPLTTQELLDEGTFVVEALPLNYYDTGWGNIVKTLSILNIPWHLAHLATAEVAEELASVAIQFRLEKAAEHYVQGRTTFQLVVPSNPSDSIADVIANPIWEHNRLPVGKPLIVTGRLKKQNSRHDEWHFTLEPESSKVNWARYELPDGYGWGTISSVHELMCDRHTTILGQVTVIGQVEYRWIQGNHFYLQLLYVPSSDCSPPTVVRPQRVLVKLPVVDEAPVTGSVVRVSGELQFETPMDDSGGIYPYGDWIIAVSDDDTIFSPAGDIQTLVGFDIETNNWTSAPPDYEPVVLAIIESPVDLHLYDANGSHVGATYDSTGNVNGVENEINGSIYNGPDHEPEFIIAQGSAADGYEFRLIGTEDGTFKLTLYFTTADGKIAHTIVFEDVPVTPDLGASYFVSEQTGFNLQIDTDNDGEFDSILAPSEHTVDAFNVLEAKANIDPNKVRLRSKKKWLTAYIEIQENDVEFNAFDIDLSTVTLNGIPAESDPRYGFVHDPEIIDRDGDGLPELMVKFPLSRLSTVLTPASNLEIVVTGTVSNAIFEAGTHIDVIE